jgi:hypothetical protein
VVTRRWTYSYRDDRVLCELVHDDGAYEMRTFRPHQTPTEHVEHYSDLTPALLRQCELEAALIGCGWTLDDYAVER